MKKLVSLLVAAGMLAAPAANVMGAEFVQADLFSVFDSMLGYTSTSADSNLPQGWTTLRSNPGKGESRAALADSETVGTTNTLKLTGTGTDAGAAMRFPFSEVAKTGKIHVGFDMKADGKIRLGGHYVRGGNYNPEDYVGADGAGWYVNNTYFVYDAGALNTYQPTDIPENQNIKAVSAVSAAAWHRYDVYIDIDAHSYNIYVDGEKQGDDYSLAMYELKSFWIQCDTGTAYIDNVYLNHYQTENAFDGMKVTADSVQNGIVNVTFSEPIASGAVFTDDFSAVNTATNVKYEPTEAEEANDNPGYNLMFEDLPMGEYEITVSNAYTGKISRTAAANTAKFTVKADLENEPHYFMNKDFDDYAGGMPIGWELNSAWYDYGYSDDVNALYKSAEHDGGKALNITSAETAENTIEYKFPTTVYDGKFTVEFDAYRGTGEKWAIGLLTPAEYSNELVSDSAKTKNSDKDADWWTGEEGMKVRRDELQSRRIKTILFATWNGEKLCYQTDLDTWFNGTVSNVTIPENQWTHVKAVIDADACEYRVSVNGGAEQKVTGVTRLKRRQLYNVITGKNENIMGISGLRLHTNSNSKDVKFDNIKVYSGGSAAYNLYEDFNTMGSPVQPYNSLYMNQAGAKDCNSTSAWSVVAGETGRSGEASDKAMKIKFEQNQDFAYYRPISVPVKAGHSFDVEFDIKNTSDDGRWELILADDDYKIGSIDAASCKNFMFNNWVIGKRAAENIYAGTGAANSLGTDTGIQWKTGEWHHIKLSVIAGAEPRFELSVTYQDGTQAAKWTGAASEKFNNKDTSLLGIESAWSKSYPIIIDNLTVKEYDAYSAGITSVKAVDFEGAKTVVNGTVSGNAEGLEIKLSNPIADTDAVKLYYADKGNKVSAERYIVCTKTLSDDGCTVNIVFNELPEAGRDIILGIAQNNAFTDGYLNNFTGAEKSFRIVNEGKFVVKEFRAYTYVAGRKDAHGQEYPDAWVPYTGESFAGLTDLSQIKLVAKGYNTDADAKIFLSGNDYKVSTDGVTQLIDGKITTRTVGRGNFEQVLDNLPLDSETETFKGMLWTYPGMVPLENALEYSVK